MINLIPQCVKCELACQEELPLEVLHQDVSDDKSVTSEQEEKIDVLVNST
jgi:hypothetical protein